MSKLIGEFKIGFDDEAKAVISALEGKLDEVARGLAAKKESHADRLLAAMQADAANDAPQPEIKGLGQWVFEGLDEKYQSAAMDDDGVVFAYECPLKDLVKNTDNSFCYWFSRTGANSVRVCTLSDGSNWEHYAIQRETVNDVDYLTSSAPKQKGIPTFFEIDEYDSLSECVPRIDEVLAQPNWLSESVPKITDADMQLIFIKNLSDVLIQRMHSMDRFSEDDYHIGAEKLMSWDIVIDQASHLFGVVVNNKDNILSAFFFKAHCEKTGGGSTHNFHTNSLMSRANRTITEAELPAFRAALEACYA
ncbi:hypothetical protein ACQKCW_03910 [Psychrobacter pacificensis]|uniref:hypothetical protein n=1 Tax=Psychrobacter pacificensis TaxID=112002 RepID=UPI003CFFCA2B